MQIISFEANNDILRIIRVNNGILQQIRPNNGILHQIRSHNAFLQQIRPNYGIFHHLRPTIKRHFTANKTYNHINTIIHITNPNNDV